MSAPSFSLVGLGPILNCWKYFVAGAGALIAVVSIAVVQHWPDVYRSAAVFIFLLTNRQPADSDRLLETQVKSCGKLDVDSRAEDLDRVITRLTTRNTELQQRLVAARSAFENAELGIKSCISSIYLLQKAQPATQKFKPARTLMELGSILLALSAIFAALPELYRYNRPSAAQLA
ncbi:hypothetical protein [Hymenobacter arizonensis]|uniref:Uncharacterized protein n=1 Tax=Hymenobacter arizonensis TaxID=1227077 RepID=A0A1I5SHK5_HYMAR|nr:hypothetical protein [Hymenobacter arizonensis]SFP70234.1 hypothetical protein SAMN04515668_0064 [Hymenobacter arizonensis]